VSKGLNGQVVLLCIVAIALGISGISCASDESNEAELRDLRRRVQELEDALDALADAVNDESIVGLACTGTIIAPQEDLGAYLAPGRLSPIGRSNFEWALEVDQSESTMRYQVAALGFQEIEFEFYYSDPVNRMDWQLILADGSTVPVTTFLNTITGEFFEAAWTSGREDGRLLTRGSCTRSLF
jgi:hypothetical protein